MLYHKCNSFQEKSKSKIDNSVNNFDENPKNNFILLDKVLKMSNDYNPIFIHFVSSGYTYNLYTKYMNEYGLL